MPEILAGHEERLSSAAPYRIPTRLLQSGAETPSRLEDTDYYRDIRSRSPSPIPSWNAPPQMGSRAPTPTYIAPERAIRQQTPLFLRDSESRGPTPFQSREETPWLFPSLPPPVSVGFSILFLLIFRAGI